MPGSQGACNRNPLLLHLLRPLLRLMCGPIRAATDEALHPVKHFGRGLPVINVTHFSHSHSYSSLLTPTPLGPLSEESRGCCSQLGLPRKLAQPRAPTQTVRDTEHRGMCRPLAEPLTDVEKLFLILILNSNTAAGNPIGTFLRENG